MRRGRWVLKRHGPLFLKVVNDSIVSWQEGRGGGALLCGIGNRRRRSIPIRDISNAIYVNNVMEVCRSWTNNRVAQRAALNGAAFVLVNPRRRKKFEFVANNREDAIVFVEGINFLCNKYNRFWFVC